MMQEIQESKVELRQNRQNMYLEVEFQKVDRRFEFRRPKSPRNQSEPKEN